jgi:hypothetical protein
MKAHIWNKHTVYQQYRIGYIFSLSVGRLWEIHMCSVKKATRTKRYSFVFCYCVLHAVVFAISPPSPPPLIGKGAGCTRVSVLASVYAEFQAWVQDIQQFLRPGGWGVVRFHVLRQTNTLNSVLPSCVFGGPYRRKEMILRDLTDPQDQRKDPKNDQHKL